MRTRMLTIAAAVPLLLAAPAAVAAAANAATSANASVTAPSAGHPCGALATPPTYTHVIWVLMENHSYNTIIGSSQAPYINSLARACGLATNYHNISHPSLPNYVGMTSGLGYAALQKFKPDCNPSSGCSTAAASIFGQDETWKAYEETMPSNCYPVNSGEYAVRHNPPPYFSSLQGCSKFDVPYTQLASDLAAKQLPAFSFITPNVINDMHDGTIADGDKWLAANLPAIFNSPQYRNGSTAVFLTWDEGEGGTAQNCATNTTDVGCHVATIVISPSTKPGTKSGTLFNHYSLLGTAEQLLGLPKLGLAASNKTMTSAFHL
jgi:phosphatidylinositol-3-phosphatase